ncbi:LysR family transcriptional regulator [Brevibacillus humidisoli]|uniref:LysR family transcriptional regulator n=1 Tax=Brevibacillus humidisoli TaxID=2895522 RepID=UPI001E656CFA|nr:LysR family transcriptional regulator [Brevibacillus humidisoli]UFJ39290.1 LysR family transcriptional regulator [Brevibacillus humidisoli]
MELLQLHYFRTVAKHEHMTRAAQELRIAQPALSKTISRLEEDLGVPLFDRQGRQIRLNTYGKAFLDKVNAALNLLEEGRREVVDLAGMDHGSIHLAAPTLDRLTEPLGAFVSRYPDVNIRITQAPTEEMTRLIDSGEVDFCFSAMPLEGQWIRSASVLREDVYLAVSAGHRLAGRQSVSLKEITDEPFIGYKEEFVFQRMNDAFFREAGIAPKFICRVDEPSAVAKLVQAGLGIALIGSCGRDPKSELTTIPIEYPVCKRDFKIFWHDKRYLSLAARKFREAIIAYYADPLDGENALATLSS